MGQDTKISGLGALSPSGFLAGTQFPVADPASSLTLSVRGDALGGGLLRLLNVFHVDDPKYGGTADTAAFAAAIADAVSAGGGVVKASPGRTYSVLSLAMASNVVLDLRGATVQKNGGGAGTCVINLTGTTTATSTTLSGNAAIGDTDLSVTSSTGFAADDLVLVFDSTFKYTTNGRNQEINRVDSVSAGHVVLKNRLIGSYAPASTATVVKLSAIDRAHILGGLIDIPVGTAGGGILGVLCNDCTVEHTKIRRPSDMPGIRFDQSRGVQLLYPRIRDGQSNSTSGTSYGWIFNESCHACEAIGVHTSNIRENPITNNGRHITVNVCTDEGAYDNSFNTHGSGNEHVRYIGCKSLSPRQYGFACSFSGNNASDQNISFDECSVYRAGASAFASNGDVGKEPKNISWNNCKADGFGVLNAASVGLLIANTIGFKVNGGDYSGASIATNTTQGIYSSSSQNGEIANATARDVANGWGIQQASNTNVTIRGNTVRNVSSNPIRSVVAGTNITIRDNNADASVPSLLGTERVEGNQWGTKFDRDRGATSVADGGTIAHNCRTTPTTIRVTPSVASQMISVTAKSSTTFTVAIKTDAGAAGTTQTVYWDAEA